MNIEINSFKCVKLATFQVEYLYFQNVIMYKFIWLVVSIAFFVGEKAQSVEHSAPDMKTRVRVSPDETLPC